MNRAEQAVEIITALAKCIVGHPKKLASRHRTLGNNTILFVRAVKCDTGRLIGPGGSMHRALQQLGNELALTPFELIVEEATLDAPVVQYKRADGIAEAANRLHDVLGLLFNNDFKMRWASEGGSNLVEVTVGAGFEPERVEGSAENLRLIYNAIGRAHDRNIRIWIAEAAAKT